MTARGSRVAANIAFGAGMGFFMATGFSALVLVLAVLRGSTDYPRYGMTTWTIIRSYSAVGLPAGAVAGLLRPLARWRAGAAVIGWVAGAIVHGGIGLVMSGPSTETLVAALVLGLAGALVGYQQWGKPGSAPPARR